METFGIISTLKLLGNFGVLGLIIFLWWYDNRQIRNIVTTHKEELSGILERYEADMAETRKMYESNVALVKDYRSIAGDLKDIIVMNTEVITKQTEAIKQNQFCPSQRVEKKLIEVSA